jgi:hypothetical protein
MEIIRHRIGRTFALAPLVAALSSPITAGPAFKIALTVLRYFFYPQFETRLFPRRRPVVRVDHPLDRQVPFRPDLVKEYLTFFFLWINSALHIARSFGRPGRLAFREYIIRMDALYRDCASVYLRCQSTTERPRRAANGFFSVIHGLDPHLHCVPSLHVLIVTVNALLGERFIRSLAGPEIGPWHEKAIAYMRQEALRITESVLFVKQHSVNCIGVSIFCLRAWYPEIGEAGALAVAEGLFTYEGRDLPCAGEVRSQAAALYRRLWADHEASGGRSWKAVVLAYLRECEPVSPWVRGPSGRFVIP